MARQAGVFYREFDLSQIAIANANLPAGIVVAARRGPVNKRVLTSTPRNWTDTFGTPDPKISFASYCALAYLEQGNQLYTVRAVGANALYGCLMLQQKVGDVDPVFTTLTDKDPENFDFSTSVGGSTQAAENLVLFYPKGPGSYSKDLRVAITSANLNPVDTASFVSAVTSSGGTLAAGTFSYAVTAINAYGETAATPVLDVTIAAGTSNKVTLSWAEVPGATGYKVYGRTKDVSAKVSVLAIVNTTSYTDTGIAVSGTATQPSVSSIPVTDEFTIDFYDASVSEGKPLESFTVTLGNKLNGFGRQMRIEDVINKGSTLFNVVNNTSLLATLPTVKSIIKTTPAVGDSGAAITDSDVVNAWNLFSDTEQVYVRILINGGYSTPAVQRAMVGIAESRQDCIAFLDMPSDKQRATDAVDYRNNQLNVNSNRAALFAQDLYILDKYNKVDLYVPPSGHMAALAAKTAFIAAAWYPMAGLTRGQLNVLGVRYKYENGERELLKTAQINYVREFQGQGIALYEQVTMQAQQSALSWISVRFLLDEIQIACRAYLAYSVHELNDDFLKRQIVTGITDFLQDIKNKRGLKKFLVVCDARNNSAQAEGEGRLYVDVYLAPTLPADQIILTGVLTKQDANFEELIGSF
jgi:phage tail sheath protein FI